MFIYPENLQSGQYQLIQMTEQHRDALYAVASDPQIWEQHPAKRYQREVFNQFFDDALTYPMVYIVLDLIMSTGENIIGSTRFYTVEDEPNSIAIGYTFLAKTYWGTDANATIKKMMIDYAVTQKDVEKIVFHIAQINIRSQKAVEKLGAICEKNMLIKEVPYCYYALTKI